MQKLLKDFPSQSASMEDKSNCQSIGKAPTREPLVATVAPSEDGSRASSTASSQTVSPALLPHQGTESVLGRDPTEVNFFCLLHSELQKAVRFFRCILQEYTLRVARLHEGFEILDRTGSIVVQDHWLVLARAAFRVYKDLLLLELYAIMTFCSFSKILKKHDKATGRDTRAAFMRSMVHGANFSDTLALQTLIRSVERRYSQASDKLVAAGRTGLQEDERLFISMVTKLNADVLEVADSEGAPVPTSQTMIAADGPAKSVVGAAAADKGG